MKITKKIENRKIKESSYQIQVSIQFYSAIVKKYIIVQAWPNQYPVVLVFPHYCKQLQVTQAKAY